MWFDKEFIIRLVKIAGITMAVYLLFRYLFPLVVPFILAIFVAGWLNPAATYLNRKIHVPYKLGSVILVLIITAVISTTVGTVFYFILQQVKRLCSNLPFIQSELCNGMENMCKCCDEWLGVGSGKMYSFLQLGTDYLGNNWGSKLLPFVTETAFDVCIWLVSSTVIFMFFLIGTWLFMEDYDVIKKESHDSYIIKKLKPVGCKLRKTIGAYFKAQGIIICIVTVICTIGLAILGNPYALLIGLVIAVLDALPIIGSGVILVPWAIINVFQRDMKGAAIIVSVYLVCLVAREVLEPKIMGHSTGLRPIYMFISFYAGIQLFGIIGVFLGPICFVIIQTVYLMTICPKEQSP